MNSPLLDSKTIGELKEKLLRKKETLEKELSSFAERNENLKGDWKTKYEDVGNAWDDNAQEVTAYATNVSIEHTLEVRLKKIDEALNRIEKDEYGFCNKDRKPIPVDRLKANPESTTCLEHAS
jgi:DnaK suppressor protein